MTAPLGKIWKILFLGSAMLCMGAAPATDFGPLKPDEAVLVMEIDSGGAPEGRTPQVALAAWSAADRKFLGDVTGGGQLFMNGEPGAGGRRLVAVRARYPAYVLKSVGVAYWSDCFNGGSYRFAVEPKQIVFLGRLNTDPSVMRLTQAVREKRLPSKSNRLLFLADDGRPNLTLPDALPGWEARVAADLAARYPSIKGQLVAGVATPVAFGSGSPCSCGATRHARPGDRMARRP